MEIISGVYKITNTITGDFYIGSSKDVKKRWNEHKRPSTWNRHPDSHLYQDMQKYGLDKFVFEILAEIEIEKLKETEQQLIETLKPTYNQMNAKGLNIERFKESHRKASRKYRKTDKCKEYQKEYCQKHKKTKKEYCCYNDEVLTLNALVIRFYRAGIPHPQIEAKKYLIQ